MRKPVLAGLLSGVLFTPLAFLLALYSAGAGHGDYVFARLLFPIPMLATLFTNDTLGTLSLTIAAVQFPAYGAFAGWALARRRILPAMLLAAGHVGAVVVAFSGVLSAFSG